MKKVKPIDWNLAEVWNRVAYKEQRQLEKRDYVYASELGLPFYDRWLKMKAVPYTNPPNDRSLRKFLAGNIMEYVTKQILIAAGIYRQDEVKLDSQPYADCLAVHGRCDFIAGGYVDPVDAMLRVSELRLPDFLHTVATKLIGQLAGRQLVEKILEIKSVSSYGMDRVEGLKAPIPHHTLQAYHYHRNGKLPADVAYLCKDDLRMKQFAIVPKQSEPLYRNDLAEMTDWYKGKKKPPLAPLLTFDYTTGQFVKNLHVEYSPYLEHYGFKSPDDYRTAIAYVRNWNRTLNRYAANETGGKTAGGKPIQLTPKNIQTRNEIAKAGFDFNALLAHLIKIGYEADEE